MGFITNDQSRFEVIVVLLQLAGKKITLIPKLSSAFSACIDMGGCVYIFWFEELK